MQCYTRFYDVSEARQADPRSSHQILDLEEPEEQRFDLGVCLLSSPGLACTMAFAIISMILLICNWYGILPTPDEFERELSDGAAVADAAFSNTVKLWGHLHWACLSLVFLYTLCNFATHVADSFWPSVLDDFTVLFQGDMRSFAISGAVTNVVCALGFLLFGLGFDALESSFPSQRWTGHGILAVSLIGSGVATFLIPRTVPSIALFTFADASQDFFEAAVLVLVKTLTIRVAVQAEDAIDREGVLHIPTGCCVGALVTMVDGGLDLSGCIGPLATNLAESVANSRIHVYTWVLPLMLVVVGFILISPSAPGPLRSNALSADRNSASASADDANAINVHLREVGDCPARAVRQRAHHIMPFDVQLFAFFFMCKFLEGWCISFFAFRVSALHRIGFTENYASMVLSAMAITGAVGRLISILIGPRFSPSQILLTLCPLGLILACGRPIHITCRKRAHAPSSRA